jgi:hypothetical protein
MSSRAAFRRRGAARYRAGDAPTTGDSPLIEQ